MLKTLLAASVATALFGLAPAQAQIAPAPDTAPAAIDAATTPPAPHKRMHKVKKVKSHKTAAAKKKATSSM